MTSLASRLAATLVLICTAGMAAWVGWIGPGRPEAGAFRNFYAAPVAMTLENATSACLGARPCPPASAQQFARALAMASPATAPPHLLLAQSALTRGDSAAAADWASRALARDPYNSFAMAILADDAIKRNDMARAFNLLVRLVEANAEQPEAYARVMAGLLTRPDGAAEFLALVKQKWRFAPLIIHYSGDVQIPPETLLAIARELPGSRSGLLNQIQRLQGSQAAFLAWLELAQNVPVKKVRWPYNPTFQELSESAPFNWTLTEDAVNFADGGGLEAVYSGERATLFATQTILLTPGQYRFRALMAGQAKPNGSGFEWRIQCAITNATLAVAKIDTLTPHPAETMMTFDVPAQNCTSQVLSLHGAVGDFPTRARLFAKSVAIDLVPVTTVASAL